MEVKNDNFNDFIDFIGWITNFYVLHSSKTQKTDEKTAKIAKNSRGGLKLYEKLPETLRRRKITSLALFLCLILQRRKTKLTFLLTRVEVRRMFSSKCAKNLTFFSQNSKTK